MTAVAGERWASAPPTPILEPRRGSAPSTPGLGPSRSGSVSGVPWQLVEVNNTRASGVHSQPNSPSIPLLSSQANRGSPVTQPAPAPTVPSEDGLYEQSRPGRTGKGKGRSRKRQTWDEDDSFDSTNFLGDWIDNHGHCISVMPAEAVAGVAHHRSGRRQAFLAILQRNGNPDKRLNISRDRSKKQWVCGNGILVPDDSSAERIVWNAGNGKESMWSRRPPDGPIYFDAPPADEHVAWQWMPPSGMPPFFEPLPEAADPGPSTAFDAGRPTTPAVDTASATKAQEASRSTTAVERWASAPPTPSLGSRGSAPPTPVLDPHRPATPSLCSRGPPTPSLEARRPSAPPTPGMGPRASVTGGPWQLVEVDKTQLQGRRSQTNSPKIPLLRSQSNSPKLGTLATPPTQPSADPDAAHEPTVCCESTHGTPLETQYGQRGANEGFDSACFLGDWLDNLGHQINVIPAEAAGAGSRRRGGGRRHAFVAVLQKEGLTEKRFNIARDRSRREWMCGNGKLIQEESGAEKIVWLAVDGRVSTWSRVPPDGPVYFENPEGQSAENNFWLTHGDAWQWTDPPNGPVYFDPPPQAAENTSENAGTPMGEGSAAQATGEGECNPPWVEHAYFMLPDMACGCGQAPLEWKEFRWPAEPPEKEEATGRTTSGSQPSPHADSVQEGRSHALNPSVPEFVPRAPEEAKSETEVGTSVDSRPAPSPALVVSPSPRIQAKAAPLRPAQPQVWLSEDSPDVQVLGNKLEWSVPDAWGKLSRFPKDFCITSPMFGVRRAANMQLAFYPSGCRTTEAGHCTVALTRCPDSAGIKFEFLVNGRSIGPKVCLGRRYMGDYPKPFDDSEVSEQQKVVVVMKILEILGGVD